MPERGTIMKKLFVTALLTLMTTATATACPLWECSYPADYYGCGCQCGTAYQYNQVQPIYCQYCGNEQWSCTCGSNYNYDYSCDYSGGCQMIQWANIRDECGNIIGQANAGDWIEIYYEDCETGRLWIYDYTVGIYGSVLADCVYGTYQWDGSGDNGYYNCYQGDADYSGCDYDYDCGDYDYGCCDYQDTGCGYGAYSNAYYATVCETIQRCASYYAVGGGYGWRCW